MVTKTVDIEVNLGVKGEAKASKRVVTPEQAENARKKAAAALQKQQLQDAARAEKERIRAQRAADRLAKSDRLGMSRATRALDKIQKGKSATPISTITRQQEVEAGITRRFLPLSQLPRIDKGHAATSEDRIARGVKEAEEIEARLKRKRSKGGLGGILTGLGQLPSFLAMGMATGHPAAIPGALVAGGHAARKWGQKKQDQNAKVDPDTLTNAQKMIPGAAKVVGAAAMAVGALQVASINKRLEITQERARLELPLFQSTYVSGETVSYEVPKDRRLPGAGKRQKAVRTDLGDGGQTVYRAYPPVDTKAPIDTGNKALKKTMPSLNLYRYLAETYGMDPQEAATTLRDFTVGAGVTNSFTKVTTDLLGQARIQGIGMPALTQVARLAGAGGGATYGAGAPGTKGDLGGVLSKIIGSAESVGLRGSRIDEYMQRTAAATSQLAEKGFMMSVEGANELALAINKQGFYEASGTGALRTAQRLQSLGPRTAQDLGTQMFAPLARGVMLAKGMEGAGSITEFFENLSNLSKSRTGGLETIDAFRRFLGEGEGSLMGLIGAGESVATGRAALQTRALSGAPDMTVLRGEDFASSFGISRALAGRQVSRLEEVSIETSQPLVSILERFDQILLAFTADDSLMAKILATVDDYLPAIRDAIQKL